MIEYRPAQETEGITALRSLLAAPLHALGHTHNTHVIDSRYRLVNVLGMGSFCVAFTVQDTSTATGAEDARSLVLKQPKYSRRLDPRQLQHLQQECQTLRCFTQARLPNLPWLHDVQHEVAAGSLYLVTTPVGAPLPAYAHGVPAAKREAEAAAMYAVCAHALQAAHALGFCHSDIGPDNIIAHKGTFYIIDWGLARAPNADMHRYNGRMDFMHDDLLKYFDLKSEYSDSDEGAVPPVPFKPAYDLQALKYVQYAYCRGKRNLEVPWWGNDPQSTIEERAKWIAAGPHAVKSDIS